MHITCIHVDIHGKGSATCIYDEVEGLRASMYRIFNVFVELRDGRAGADATGCFISDAEVFVAG